MSQVNPKIIVALDIEEKMQLHQLISQLDPNRCRLKVGITLFSHFGPQFITDLQGQGFDIFLDLKFHDIPHQVQGACKSAALLGVWMMNVHALGGLAMMLAAKGGIESAMPQLKRKPLLIGVTLLTSSGIKELQEIGMKPDIDEMVMRLATLCYEASLDGVVCSAKEAKLLKKRFGKSFLCVTPGIRLAQNNVHDQHRVMTPERAIAAGSDYLVIGRPLTQASQPKVILEQINESIIL